MRNPAWVFCCLLTGGVWYIWVWLPVHVLIVEFLKNALKLEKYSKTVLRKGHWLFFKFLWVHAVRTAWRIWQVQIVVYLQLKITKKDCLFFEFLFATVLIVHGINGKFVKPSMDENFNTSIWGTYLFWRYLYKTSNLSQYWDWIASVQICEMWCCTSRGRAK